MTASGKFDAGHVWILQVAKADEAPFVFRMKPGGIKTIGRATRADFVLDAALVSRLHCRLEAADDVLEVVDLSSTNGTYVNDERVKRGRLREGDRLRIGRVELVVDRQRATS